MYSTCTCKEVVTHTPITRTHTYTHTHTQQHYPAGYAQQQCTSNVVVVQQSAAVIPVVTRPEGYQPEAGQAALVFAMIITILALIFGCWWSIICSIPGMVFASSVSVCVYMYTVPSSVCVCVCVC